IFTLIDIVYEPVQNNGYKQFVKQHRINVTKDIIYDFEFPEIRKGDLYIQSDLPSTGKLPVFINLHGGGFVAGNKRHRRYFSAYVASLGYAVFNINYGIASEYKFPFCVRSGVVALNWVVKNAETFNLDPSKIVVSGDSAGANIASLICTAASNEEYAKEIGAPASLTVPTGALLFCGPFDLEISLNKRLPLDLANKIIEETTGYDKDHVNEFKYFKYFAPMEFINERFPKTFLVYAKKDIFCAQQSEMLEQTLNEKNIPVESFYSERFLDNHCFHLNHNFKVSQQAIEKASEFLEALKNEQSDADIKVEN
ncbi:MAG: alpha/beta hydrolase, partial [Clostridiales bacterium]|nr:alpha/beta hydrolase [Clostridiales bacterium]